MTPGRNDPCPCGSGEKYKRCCGKLELRDECTEAVRRSAWKKLLTFSRRDEFDHDRAIAKSVFWGPWASELSEDDLEALASHPMVVMNFENFFALDVRLDEDKGVTDFFLDRRAESLSTIEHAYVEDLARSHVGLYEVLSSGPAGKLRLRDLLASGDLEVGTPRTSPDVEPGDLLAARIVRNDFEADLYDFPPTSKDTVLARIHEDLEKTGFTSGRTDFRSAMKRVGFRFHGLWIELVGAADED